MASSLPHPIPYQGSKRALAPLIAPYFPEGISRLVEPFAGSGALSIYAAHHSLFDSYLLNDINTPLIGLWRAILKTPVGLADTYTTLWHLQMGRERRFYDLVRARFNRTHQPYYLLYLLARCVKAAVRYNAQGEFNQSPDNRRKGRLPASMRADIGAVSGLMNGRTQLVSEDFRVTLERVTEGDMVYLDPPYQGVGTAGDPRYIKGISHEMLTDALHDLNRRHIAYIVSYDGRMGEKRYGQDMPADLRLHQVELAAGRSSQATLLGRKSLTFESLYLSPSLMERLGAKESQDRQLSLWELAREPA